MPETRLLMVSNAFAASQQGYYSVCEDLARRFTTQNISVIRTSLNSDRFTRILDMLYTAWSQRSAYTLAHIDLYSGAAFVWAELICRLLRWLDKPYILTLHGGNLPEFAQRYPQRIRRLLHSANALTTPSAYLQEQMAAYHPNIHLIPNPLDLAAYTYQPRQTASPCLIWLRAYHHVYNPALAVKSLALLREAYPDIQLVMVGPDKGDGSLAEVHKLITELSLEDRITVHGGIPKLDVPEWLNRADIFINTTNIDNTPVSVLEAMACGLCVISTNVGGIPYLLDHETDALLIPANNPAALAEAVQRVLTQSDLAAHLSVNARRKAERVDWSAVWPEWQNLFKSLL